MELKMNNMLRGYQQLKLDNKAGGKEVMLERNFEGSKEPTDILITVDGKTAVIDFKDLYSFVYVEANGEMKADLIIEKKVEMFRHKRQHMIELQKDMKKGEQVVANCIIDIPNVMVEAMREEIKSGSMKVL